jgi:hypothetical protein
MNTLYQWLCMVLLAISSSCAVGQTVYNAIETGMVLSGGIGLGSFVKPLPLPPGDWLVVSKTTDDVTLTGGLLSSTPRIYLTLKNTAPRSLLFAMVLSFTPDTSKVNWQNSSCKETDGSLLLDDFGVQQSSLLFACATGWSHSSFKSVIEKAPTSSNNWRKTKLAALAAYPGDMENDVLWIKLDGNRYLGRSVNFVFFVKRESDLRADPVYASQIKAWVHTTGLALFDFLEDRAATFTLPATYVAQARPKTEPVPTPVATPPVEPAKPPAAKLPDDDTHQLRADLEAQRRLLENEKRAFEQRKASELEQMSQQAEKDWKERTAKAKTACLQAFSSALSANDLAVWRHFLKAFPEDECARHAQANQKMAALEDIRRKETAEQENRAVQAKALIGLMAAYQQEYPYCEAPMGSHCLPITYFFEVKGKIINVDLKRESVQIQVAETVLIGHKVGSDKQLATRWQDAAANLFQTRTVGSKQWKTKSDVGLNF